MGLVAVQARSSALMNARLADVCIGTSAAPTVLPAHYFETVDHRTGASRSFNVIDGGLAANNPVLIYCLLGYSSSFFSFFWLGFDD